MPLPLPLPLPLPGACCAAQGYGMAKFSNGDMYTGHWKDGVRHGEGICVFGTREEGAQYTGQWECDQIAMNGNGTLTLADGTVHKYS